MADASFPSGALVETWHVNNRVNLRLLDALSDEQLAAVIFPRGKSVISYFVHMHMARFYWLERRAPALAKDLDGRSVIHDQRHQVRERGRARPGKGLEVLY
jgi:uncharacterized damage-inducible protein DinB